MPRAGARSSLSPEARTDAAAAHAAAVRLLARRDYATAELGARLAAQGFAAAAVGAAIAELTAAGTLNEARYAHNYVTWHAGRGQGPLRIGAALRRCGVSEACIHEALAGGPDWAQLARKVCRARFGPRAPEDWAHKARQARFLQYRGFSSDHIRAATGADPDLD